MTKQEFQDNYDRLIKDTENDIKEEGLRLIESRAIEIEGYEDNYLLPKIVLTVALENCAGKVSPPASWKAEWRDIRNLRKF